MRSCGETDEFNYNNLSFSVSHWAGHGRGVDGEAGTVGMSPDEESPSKEQIQDPPHPFSLFI